MIRQTIGVVFVLAGLFFPEWLAARFIAAAPDHLKFSPEETYIIQALVSISTVVAGTLLANIHNHPPPKGKES